MKRFELAQRALRDLGENWEFVSEDSCDAADRVLEEFYRVFQRLAEMPGISHKREDLTPRDVIFWTLHCYLIIYRDSEPLKIARIIHRKRDGSRILRKQ